MEDNEEEFQGEPLELKEYSSAHVERAALHAEIVRTAARLNRINDRLTVLNEIITKGDVKWKALKTP